MIDWMEIRDFAIARHVELEFDAGFTAVTGETGSGKSLIVDAISILLGHRSDAGYIRQDAESAELQANFSLARGHSARSWLADNGFAAPEDQDCLVRRVLRRGRASKGYINGHAATAAQLKNLGALLVDIHGQNEHHSLQKKSTQLALLDANCGHQEQLDELTRLYTVLDGLHQQIAQLSRDSHAGQERADLLRFQLDELNELNPIEGEWDEISTRHRRANHQQELRDGAREIALRLYESDQQSINAHLLSSISRLEQLTGVVAELKQISQILSEAQLNVEEAARQLRPYYQEDYPDPEEIAELEQRVSMYHALARKHRIEPQQLATHCYAMRQELGSLVDPDTEIQRLQAELNTQQKRYDELAERISRNRHRTARQLSQDVTQLMQELGMSGGTFAIAITPVTERPFTRFGRESVEFFVATNPGHPSQALSRVASGGELSRLSLAIQVILAADSQSPTMLFDEVDVGIGGEVANVVGNKLKELGQCNQVICITHLSQVAARGNHHFNVSKGSEGSIEARVTRLNTQQRIEEIARMTSGEVLSRQSLAHAREMLNLSGG